MKFKRLEYFGFFLLTISIIAFWPRYFSKFFDGTADFAYYFHIHTVTAFLWVILLIVQPILIRRKQLAWHRIIGRLSYGLVPVLLISAILLRHYQTDPDSDGAARRLFISSSNVFIFGFGYALAIIKRKDLQLHARGMIVTGLPLIPVTLTRITYFVLGIGSPTSLYLGIAPLYALLIFLIYAERNSPRGRWVFPLVLVMFLFRRIIAQTGIELPYWEAFAHWFLSLPLT